jgi:hypothetical protein
MSMLVYYVGTVQHKRWLSEPSSDQYTLCDTQSAKYRSWFWTRHQELAEPSLRWVFEVTIWVLVIEFADISRFYPTTHHTSTAVMPFNHINHTTAVTAESTSGPWIYPNKQTRQNMYLESGSSSGTPESILCQIARFCCVLEAGNSSNGWNNELPILAFHA